jgi:GT2 family glycosyltransferase
VAGFDGVHEPASHRSIPTPATAFYRLSGLSRLFPNHPVYSKYNMPELDADTGTCVEAVSGACMMLRRAMLDEIGLLDEEFFLYGEDLDLCYRAGQHNWKIYYLPEARIKHLKGGSSRRNQMRSHYEFYNAMAIFHRKHFAPSCGLLLNSLIYAGIWSRALLTWPLAIEKMIRQ